MKNRCRIAACAFLLLAPFMASCALSEDELATDDQGSTEEIAADKQAEPTHQSLFGDACKNTDITITNLHKKDGVNAEIEVRRVEFYSQSEGAWIYEDLATRNLIYGQTYTWWNEDLRSAENDKITHWRVYFRDLVAGTYSSVIFQTIDTPDQICYADADFSMTVL